MLELIISGGQSGADIAGWRAAAACGVRTGGYMPAGFATEDGPRPEYAARYGAVEYGSDYPARTAMNASSADATLWFGRGDSRGHGCTAAACRRAGRPLLTLSMRPGMAAPGETAAVIREFRWRSLNVAGNRASLAPPGFEADVEAFVATVLRAVNRDRAG